MAITGISSAALNGVAGAGASSPGGAAKAGKFGLALKTAQKPQLPQAKAAPGQQTAGQAAGVSKAPVAKALDHVASAQQRMDQVLKLAESGKSFTPAELLSLQTQVYRASQELDLAGKVVEKATGGLKQVLQTQV